MRRRSGLALELTAAEIEQIDRKGHRRPVRILARLQRDGAAVATVTIRNLSRYGFMGEGQGRVDIGESLTLTGPWGSSEVTIAWALAGRIGGEFLPPLDLPTVERMLAQDLSRG